MATTNPPAKELATRMSKRLANYKLTDAAIKQLADRVLMDDLVIHRFSPCIYGICIDYFGDKMPDSISGGMRKRVGLARAIVTQPEIILYDEPTSGLDPVISRQIDLLIDDLRRRLGVTSVVVTHDLYSALHIGTRVAMLHEGRFVVCAPPEEFIASKHPVVRDFLRSQGIVGLQDVRKAFGT